MDYRKNLNARRIIALAATAIALIGIIAFATHVIIYKSKESPPTSAPVMPTATPTETTDRLTLEGIIQQNTCTGAEPEPARACMGYHEDEKKRDDLGEAAKFSPPTIANGKVYMATFSGYLAVYGQLS